jgi:hypothetical protein
MPEPFKIKCRYCGNVYAANKKNRSHCRRSACRDKEIQRQLSQLQAMLEMLCTNNIKACVEIRLAGNDKLSHEAKIESISNVAKGIVVTTPTKNGGGVMPETLMPYFRILLWKGIKGNFVINIYGNGTIDPNILNQTFTPLAMPMIIGNNLLIHGNQHQ